MGNIFSSNIGNTKERWALRITLNARDMPLPNTNDFYRTTLGINYCLYNKDVLRQNK
ncbi:hypothetical protein VEE15_02370 [Escherichia coli]|nr:hypothetical protein VEE15_02370 [Escherichia coli]